MSDLPKRKLTLEDLRVESFVTTPVPEGGTVNGLAEGSCPPALSCTSQTCDVAGVTCPRGCLEMSCCYDNSSCCTATCAT